MANRMRRGRRPVMDQEPGRGRTNDLVDTNLAPAARMLADTVAHALIEPAGRRATAVFCGVEQYDWVQEVLPRLVGDLLLECLPHFIHDGGGQLAFATRLGGGPREDVLTPVQRGVVVNGQTRRILHEGVLFIHFPDRRVVVSAEDDNMSGEIRTEIGVRSDRDAAAFLREWAAYAKAHNYLRGKAFFADGDLIDRGHRYSWDSIMVPEATRRTIHTHVESFLKNRDRLRGLGVKARRGLILSGPPGTGKTLLGKVLADTLDTSFMWVTPRHITSTQSFADLLTVARFVAPVVVFLEDLDLFAEDRESGRWMGLGELMNQLDGAAENQDIVVIATTNHLEVVEKALRNRPGRFDRVLEFGPLDEPARRRMVARLLEKADVAAEDMEHLVATTRDYTGAQVEELVNTIYILAADRYTEAVSGTTLGRPAVDRPLITAALEEFRVELKVRVGFHAT